MLGRHRAVPPAAVGNSGPVISIAPPTGGNGPSIAGPATAARATAAQLRAIRAMCQVLGRSAEDLGRERYGIGALDELTCAEATALIEELKPAVGRATP